MQTALILRHYNPDILNYLGYSWLEQGRNIEQAADMIIKAYKKQPYEGHIIDSVGWVYFRLGMYNKAVAFLEQASSLNPGNAVINDHLGDAYWFAGRKNEAIFQWNHALDLKEDADSIDKKVIRSKIENGPDDNVIFTLENPDLVNFVQNLTIAGDK